MMNDKDEVELKFLKATPEIIKVEVRSRHISRKTYHTYVHYTPNGNGYKAIRRYYCQCANGMRTVGCCSHSTAIIYYLSNGRYRSKILKPAEVLMEYFHKTSITTVINDDSDED